MLFICSIISLWGGLMAFFLFQVHTLSILISLEVIMLSLLVSLYSLNLFSGASNYSFLMLLTFTACEASLALSLLVSMLRLWGDDYINSLGCMKF